MNNAGLLTSPDLELGEIGKPLNFEWNKCKLETISYGHGIAITPLQALSTYAAISNGGNVIKPTLLVANLIKSRLFQRN